MPFSLSNLKNVMGKGLEEMFDRGSKSMCSTPLGQSVTNVYTSPEGTSESFNVMTDEFSVLVQGDHNVMTSVKISRREIHDFNLSSHEKRVAYARQKWMLEHPDGRRNLLNTTYYQNALQGSALASDQKMPAINAANLYSGLIGGSAGNIGTGLLGGALFATGGGTTSTTIPASTTIPVHVGSGGHSGVSYPSIPATGASLSEAPKSNRQHIHSGDLITCRNDHPICIAMDEFDVGRDSDWRDHMGFWQQAKPRTSAGPLDYECEICKCQYGYYDQNAEWHFIIRKQVKEEASA